MHQLSQKDSFHPKHTFQGILKSKISRFLEFVNKLQILMKRGRYCQIHYPKRTLQKDGCAILKLKLSVNYKYNNAALIQLIQWCSKPCGISRCRSCEILCSCHNITSKVTNKSHWMIGNLNCGSSNIIYICKCLHCSKQYVGKSNGELRVRMNSHRYAINSKAMSSALFTHLLEHAQINKDMSEPSLDDLIPIPRVH